MVNPKTNTSYILIPSDRPSEGREKRGVTSDPNKFWPNALVPYAFHDSITGRLIVTKLQDFVLMYGNEGKTNINNFFESKNSYKIGILRLILWFHLCRFGTSSDNRLYASLGRRDLYPIQA